MDFFHLFFFWRHIRFMTYHSVYEDSTVVHRIPAFPFFYLIYFLSSAQRTKHKLHTTHHTFINIRHSQTIQTSSFSSSETERIKKSYPCPFPRPSMFYDIDVLCPDPQLKRKYSAIHSILSTNINLKIMFVTSSINFFGCCWCFSWKIRRIGFYYPRCWVGLDW